MPRARAPSQPPAGPAGTPLTIQGSGSATAVQGPSRVLPSPWLRCALQQPRAPSGPAPTCTVVSPSLTLMLVGQTWQMAARLNRLPATTVAWSVMALELRGRAGQPRQASATSH